MINDKHFYDTVLSGDPGENLVKRWVIANLNAPFILSDAYYTDDVDSNDAVQVITYPGFEKTHSKSLYGGADGIWGYISCDNNSTRFMVAAPDEATARIRLASLQSRAPKRETPEPNTIPVTFWSMGPNGPASTLRDLQAGQWDEIAVGYSGSTRKTLETLFTTNLDARTDMDGKLILWHGLPGTGKTTALRALVREWKPWCSVHVVVDPENFLRDANYMLQVMNARELHRLIVLEDAGELLSADASTRVTHQSLSRFLNAVDGMLGQGLRFTVLITTNEKIGQLHEAVTRPGRCMSIVEFAALNLTEREAWADHVGVDISTVDTYGQTIAELYAAKEHFGAKKKEKVSMGFGA